MKYPLFIKAIAALMLLCCVESCDKKANELPEPKKSPLEITPSKLEMKIGEKKTATLQNGSGKYELTNTGTEKVAVQIEGNMLAVEAHAPGEAKITVSDKETKEKASLSVTVSAPALPEGVKVENGVLLEWPGDLIPTDGKVFLSSEIKEIGESAFYRGPVKEISIPASVKKIGKNAFAECNELIKVEMAEGVTELGESAFYQCHALETANIPASVSEMKPNVFAYCEKLTKVKLAEGLKQIGESAFVKCGALTEIAFPQSLTSIGDNAFNGCSELTSIRIPNGVNEILDNTFKGCTALVSVQLPSKLTALGRYAFNNCVALKEIALPQTLTKIDGYAFSGCTALTKIEIPQNLTEIDASTFEYCSGLTDVVFATGNKLTKIGIKAFKQCERLAKITIPQGVDMLDNFAFQGCLSLSEIELPSTLTSIRLNCFVNCKQLKKVVCRAETPPTTMRDVFKNTASEKTLVVPAQAEELYEADYIWKNFTTIETLK